MIITKLLSTKRRGDETEEQTQPQAQTKKPVNWYVDQQVTLGKWREEVIAPEVTGLSRPITVLRADRKTNLITYDWHGDRQTFCPPQWWDLGIGSGACGLGCLSCFLMLTFRAMRDPHRHLLYDNVADFERASAAWLLDPTRRRQHTLGVGIDRSDSLLYEGVTGHVRRLAPLFGSPAANPLGNKLVLLTKSANAHYLTQVSPGDRHNLVVSFSLNPQGVADLWEGIWPDGEGEGEIGGVSGGTHSRSERRGGGKDGDGGERIPPSIARRLEAAKLAQDLGFEVRIRLDPILTPDNWQEQYRAFVAEVKAAGINFRYWTLGTYREKNPQLDAWRERWGLLPMGWQPQDGELIKQGTHRHLAEARRVEIYRTVQTLIREEFGAVAKVSLCKETHAVRKAVAGMCNSDCNCLA